MASVSIQRTPGVTGNRKTWTWSAWIKRGSMGATETMMGHYTDSDNRVDIGFMAVDTLYIYEREGASTKIDFQTTRKFRDPGAWYHFVVAVDTAQAVEADRMKFYVNGTQITDWIDDNYPAQDLLSQMDYSGNVMTIGGRSSNYFSGEMSHVQWVDGAALAPTEFGSVDATSGIWKIKTGCYATPGTNGFCLKMEDSTNLDLDSSSNAHTFTTSGTLTPTKDNPSNNFCTINPLWTDVGIFSGDGGTPDISDGNLTGGKASHCNYNGTFATDTMKTYWEVYVNDTNQSMGVMGAAPTGGVTQGYADATYNAVYPYGSKLRTNGSEGSGGPVSTANSYYMFALDPANNKMWYGRNGVWVGDPAAGTGATWTTLPAIELTPNTHPMATSQNNNSYLNFGNGYFGTTAHGETNTDDAGIGLFKYDVPTGFYALCTKNLKAYG